MRVLFDITHPAQAHFFKHAIRQLQGRGHSVLVTARDKEVTLELLARMGIEAVCLAPRGSGLAGMAWELARRDGRLIRLARRFRPDVMVGRVGISIGLVGALLGVPRIIFEDTEHARLQRTLSLPFATWICTGTGYTIDHGRRQERFRGVPVLAYLHPSRFQPDPAVLSEAGLDPAQPLVVLRRTARSVHDPRRPRPGEEEILRAVERLGRLGRVVLVSEPDLSSRLERFACPVSADRVHDLLAWAALFIGDGGTMAAEAAVLGAPAVYFGPLMTGYLRALRDRYGLLHTAGSLDDGIAAAERLLAQRDLRSALQARRLWMLQDGEDIVEFTCRMCERAAAAKKRAR